MKITPNSHIVLIKVDPAVEKDESGIYIQEEWKTQPPTGTVTAVGEQVMSCKIGDKVFFERYSSIPTPFGNDIRACRDNAILGVYETE